MSASSLNTTTYNTVAANTVNNAVISASAILAWRQNVKTVVDQHVTEIDSKAAKAQAGWIAPTLLNSWVNYGSLGFAAAGYMKDTLGFVHIKGIIRSGTTANGTTLFVLPTGYRPFETHSFIVNTSNGSADTYARIDVNSNGSVVAQTNMQSAFLSLGIFPFLAEQ